MRLCLRSVCGLGLAVVIALGGSVRAADQSAASLQKMDPLVQVLVSKGVISAEEGRAISSGSAAEQRDKLVLLLKEKGIISAAEVSALRTPPPASAQVSPSLVASVAPVLPPATAQKTETAKPAAPPAPAVIPAIAPIRVLQTDGAKVGGLVPDIKLGSGAKLKLYGFLKASAVHDTSNGQAGSAGDAPLPGFIGDTGPEGAPQFHVKARAARVGSNFEWPDIAGSKVALTGKMEFDFEGNFTRAFNRNVSSIRSNQANLRLAWARLDYPASANTNIYFLAGQDWTPFGSSTLPNTIETTLVGVYFGSLYERSPQLRTGFLHNFGGPASFKFGADVAAVLSATGNVPPFISTQSVIAPTTIGAISIPRSVATIGGNVGDELAYGERQGPDSGKPDIQGRLVFQFQLDKAKGVAPAQLIVSGDQGWRKAVVPAGNIPCSVVVSGAATGFIPAQFTGTAPANLARGCPTAAALGATQAFNPAAIIAGFPQGAAVESQHHGFSGEVQLPTRYVTILGKAYTGSDLRYFFAGQLFSTFNDTAGLVNVVSVPSIDASSTVAFGCTDAACSGVRVAPQRPIRGYGGFIELGFPLSRIFNANPAGRNAGWTMNVHYGLDGAVGRDVRRSLGPALTTRGTRIKSDWSFANLQYKLNQYVTFAYEESYYRTFATPGAGGLLPLYRGIGARTWHDLRSEFATIFTF